MPAKNPRLSVVLPPALAATLAALSAETGESASSLVRSLLEQAHPSLERMHRLVKAAREAKGQIGEGIGEALRQVVDDLEGAVEAANATAEGLVLDLVAQGEQVKGRRRRATAAGGRRSAPSHPLPPAKVQAYADTNGLPPAGVTPVPVTRGLGQLQTRNRQPAKGRARGR